MMLGDVKGDGRAKVWVRPEMSSCSESLLLDIFERGRREDVDLISRRRKKRERACI